ncbi:MAG: DUF1801 domain-containing protein [Bacteroidota bacterium]
MGPIANPQVAAKFNAYPDHIKKLMGSLRQLIVDTAEEIGVEDELSETLKWGEPSYKAPKGSPIRIDWKAKNPEYYAMYVNCQSQLVPTFRQVFGDVFEFEQNRAILFKCKEQLPEEELKQCIKVALTYHQVKNQPLLGM